MLAQAQTARYRVQVSKQRLDQLLVSRGLAESRSRAQALVMAGVVFSGERKLDKPARDDKVTERIFSVRKRLLRWNRIALPKRPIPLGVQADIRARLKPEIDKLATLIGRDLSHWLEVREGRLG